MTDNDIVKALECCTNEPTLNCRNCPYEESCNMGRSDMQKAALDLINRQKAEIERLNGCVKTEEEVRVIAKETIRVGVNSIRAEAIKEFAERLKNCIHEDMPSICDRAGYIAEDLPDSIDNLVKELTEQ